MSSLIQTAAEGIRRKTALRPQIAFVLGSGLGEVQDLITPALQIPFSEIPGFCPPTVPGHAGSLILGQFRGTPILILNGRVHYYEGYDLEQTTRSIQILASFGIKEMILSNAAGGISKKLKTGDFMLIEDHVNLMGVNPLRGIRTPNRFVDMSAAYDPELKSLLRKAASKAKVRLHNGIYAAVSGPSYETPAEIRAFGRLGADAVGMSTVPEVIVARYCGMRVAAFSCITNSAAGKSKTGLSHSDVLAAAHEASSRARRLLTRFLELYVPQQSPGKPKKSS